MHSVLLYGDPNELKNLGNAIDSFKHVSDKINEINDTPAIVKTEPEKNVYKMSTLSNSNNEFDKMRASRLEKELVMKNDELEKLRILLRMNE